MDDKSGKQAIEYGIVPIDVMDGCKGPGLHTANIAQTCKAEAEGEGEMTETVPDNYSYREI